MGIENKFQTSYNFLFSVEEEMKRTFETQWVGKAISKAITALIFLFLAVCLYAQAQADRIRFKHLSVVDGLSQEAVNCIIQDRKGFMWFGTQDGLNRYDGYKFKVFSNIPRYKESLSDNFVLCISEDHHGILWVGTKAGGVKRFDPHTEKLTRFQLKSIHDADFNTMNVKVIYEDKTNILWVGTKGGGLWVLDRKTKIFNSYKNIPPHFGSIVNALYEDKGGMLWVGTEVG
jgi:ligand-binding sensor domain-containing protein